ncbi:ABC-type dipeptide transport system, periplasmic component [Marinomonas sp. MED121]|uniref:extracellular solute-binding protein n=1 Tax=Marinomonas sp. MED121 TaxID=314277 RepID=UPI000069008C|nr:extracellular solute-binding protein [Marinomonas sp. MED121]EAQ65783.1 ABC-type dipeptide transport system, periplasmic component [Marinomonas sp. MED121]
MKTMTFLRASLKTSLGALLLSSLAQATTLPANLNWTSGPDAPLFADKNAKQGGVYNLRLSTFPLTFRTIGPDSNGSFRPFLLDGQPGLLQMHPNTREYLPSLATEWAFDDDQKTVYFKLDKTARWSDGADISSADFEFLFDYMRSDNAKAPWYKDYYTNSITGITVYDEDTFALHSADRLPQDDLIARLGVTPRPKHFYPDGLPENFIKRYNWKAEPVTGPYILGKVKKGKSIEFVKVKDWWGYNNPYYQNRYNVDRVRLKIIRDQDVAMKHFEKGSIDAFSMILPGVWHNQGKGPLYDKGFIEKSWLFNDTPQGATGVWLNLENPLMQDANVRKGIAYSINVDKMIETALFGDYVHLQSFGSGKGIYDHPTMKAKPFDPKLAAEYFAKAGYDSLGRDGIRINAQGERLVLVMNYSWKAHSARTAVLREEAKKAGLDLQLNLVEGATGFKAALEKKHQAVFQGMGSGMKPAYWQYFHSANAKPQTNNFTNYQDPEMDKLIDAYDSEFNVEKKAKFSHQIQEKIMACDCFIPTYSVPYTRLAHWRYVRLPVSLGVGLSTALADESGFEYGLFWLDEETKKETLEAKKSGQSFPAVNRVEKLGVESL